MGIRGFGVIYSTREMDPKYHDMTMGMKPAILYKYDVTRKCTSYHLRTAARLYVKLELT